MNTKYTPCPWRLDIHADGSEWFGNIVSFGLGKTENGIQLIRTIDCLRLGADKEELMATGRLIAAAPELLEALTEMCETIEQQNIGISSPEQWQTVAYKCARAAIAKATQG